MAQAIAISGLVKNFGSFRALDELDLQVEVGEVHGFLGPNGSGKSTTIRVLLGMLRSDAGSVSLLGGDPWSDSVELHKRLAYVPGDVSLWPNLSGGEVIDLLGRLRGGVNSDLRDALLERFELDPTKKGRTYSKGNRQKVALVAALSSRADLLIMDEPTSGLDPLMESIFQACIQEVRGEGRTVLLSSHILAEVESLCDRVTIIREGKTVETGSLAELRHLGRTTISVRTDRPIRGLDTIDGLEVLTTASMPDDGQQTTLSLDSGALAQTLNCLTSAGVRSLETSQPTLEDLFMRHYASSRTSESAR